MPDLRLVNIVKTYGKLRAIDNLNLTVEDGENQGEATDMADD